MSFYRDKHPANDLVTDIYAVARAGASENFGLDKHCGASERSALVNFYHADWPMCADLETRANLDFVPDWLDRLFMRRV